MKEIIKHKDLQNIYYEEGFENDFVFIGTDGKEYIFKSDEFNRQILEYKEEHILEIISVINGSIEMMIKAGFAILKGERPFGLKEEFKCKEPNSLPDGDCCCNCVNQVKIMCHPGNGNKMVKEFPGGKLVKSRCQVGVGSIRQQLGWGCTLFTKLGELDSKDNIIFMDVAHGICEMHQPKKEMMHNER